MEKELNFVEANKKGMSCCNCKYYLDENTNDYCTIGGDKRPMYHRIGYCKHWILSDFEE